MLASFRADPAFQWDAEQHQGLRKRQILITSELISPVIRLTLTAADEIRHMFLQSPEDVAFAVGEPSARCGLIPVLSDL